MLKVKLTQKGKKHQRSYQIIIAEARSKRDGKYIDNLGFWNPHTKELKIDKKKLDQWIKKGAQLTEGVNKLLKSQS